MASHPFGVKSESSGFGRSNISPYDNRFELYHDHGLRQASLKLQSLVYDYAGPYNAKSGINHQQEPTYEEVFINQH